MNGLLSDVAEALEKMKRYKPLYLDVLNKTGDRDKAIEAVKQALAMEDLKLDDKRLPQ